MHSPNQAAQQHILQLTYLFLAPFGNMKEGQVNITDIKTNNES